MLEEKEFFSQRLAHSSVSDAPENAYQGLTLPSPLTSLTSKCPLQRRQDLIGKNIVWREPPRDLFKIIIRRVLLDYFLCLHY